jgi:hypothetical protein
MNTKQATKLDALFTQISGKHFQTETLETRRMDRLDFHEVAVWEIRAALEAAYKAGAASVKK